MIKHYDMPKIYALPFDDGAPLLRAIAEANRREMRTKEFSEWALKHQLPLSELARSGNHQVRVASGEELEPYVLINHE